MLRVHIKSYVVTWNDINAGDFLKSIVNVEDFTR